MIPRAGSDAGSARDVQQILTAAEVGLRWPDNVGQVVTFRYLATRAPVRVVVSTLAAPLSVFVLRAVNRSTLAIESGCRITWRWGRGTVDVSAIDVSDTAAEYDVTVGILQE